MATVQELEEVIDKMIQKGNAQTLESVKGMDSALKTEMTNVLHQYKEQSTKEMEAMKKDIVEVAKKLGRPESALATKEVEYFDLKLEDELKKSENSEFFKARKTFTLSFEKKAVSDMLTVDAGRLAAMQTQVAVRSGILETPAQTFSVRDIINVIPTNATVIRWLQENGGEGDVGMVAEGAIKPQFDFDFSQAETTVKKVAGHVRLSEEMVEDVPYITTYITVRGQRKIRNKENEQVLYGDGTGLNLRGVNIDAVAFTGAGLKVPNPTIYDVLRALQAQVAVGDYGLTAILMNPVTTASLDLLKDTTGNYILPPNIAALRGLIRETTLVPAGSFLAGDFANGVDIYDKKQLQVRFYDQDRDNAIRNMVTIVVEERLAVATIRPAAFIKGTIGAAITTITPA